MKNLSRLQLLVLTAAILALRGPAASAEEAPAAPSTVVGAWDYSKSLDHGRRIVRTAFEEAIEQLNFIYRRAALRKLNSSDPLIKTIIISRPEGRIKMELIGEKRTDFATRPGAAETITGPNGKQVELTQRLSKSDTVLEQVFVGPNGSTRSRYTLSDGGERMTYRTHIKGERLTTPIEFQLIYKRRRR